MSVSKWAYLSARCDGDFCPGDCDRCPKAETNQAIMEYASSDYVQELVQEFLSALEDLVDALREGLEEALGTGEDDDDT